VKTTIVCLDDGVTPAGDSAVVQVLKLSAERCMAYPALLEMARKARSIAIPLNVDATLLGLTSLTDALALGKPVIITQHPLWDIDVDAEGIGFALPQGDVEAWARAVQWMNDHPDEATAMGHRARALAESRYNTALFASRLVAIMQRLTAAR
jgi:glycosyltransferase involved in cell wall biosynthesis